MARVFVAVGANICPESNVPAAIRALKMHTPVTAISMVYRSEPYGRSDQPPFYNCVVELRTDMPPLEFKLQVCRRIETGLGRQRSSDKYAARTVDLDLILYDDLVLDVPGLVLPDPEIADRPFLAIPLSELAPDLILPGTDTRMADLASRLTADCLQPLESFTASLRAEL